MQCHSTYIPRNDLSSIIKICEASISMKNNTLHHIFFFPINYLMDSRPHTCDTLPIIVPESHSNIEETQSHHTLIKCRIVSPPPDLIYIGRMYRSAYIWNHNILVHSSIIHNNVTFTRFSKKSHQKLVGFFI